MIVSNQSMPKEPVSTLAHGNQEQITLDIQGFPIVFSSDGELLAHSSSDNKVYLWDINSGKLQKSFGGHTKAVTSIVFSPDNNMLVSSSVDKTIRLWNVGSKTAHKTIYGHRNTVSSVAFHPNGNILASSSNGGEVRLWNLRSGKLIRKPFKWTSRYLKAVAFSPNGKMLATGSSDLKVRLWNTNPIKMYKTRMSCSKYQHVNSLDFSPDSRKLASGLRHGMVCIWDTKTRKLSKKIYKHKKDAFCTVSFSFDGKTLAYSHHNSVYLWNLNTEEPVKLLTLSAGNLSKVKFNPNPTKKNILAISSNDGTVHLWDVENNKRLRTFTVNTYPQLSSTKDADKPSHTLSQQDIPYLPISATEQPLTDTFDKERIKKSETGSDGQQSGSVLTSENGQRPSISSPKEEIAPHVHLSGDPASKKQLLKGDSKEKTGADYEQHLGTSSSNDSTSKKQLLKGDSKEKTGADYEQHSGTSSPRNGILSDDAATMPSNSTSEKRLLKDDTKGRTSKLPYAQHSDTSLSKAKIDNGGVTIPRSQSLSSGDSTSEKKLWKENDFTDKTKLSHEQRPGTSSPKNEILSDDAAIIPSDSVSEKRLLKADSKGKTWLEDNRHSGALSPKGKTITDNQTTSSDSASKKLSQKDDPQNKINKLPNEQGSIPSTRDKTTENIATLFDSTKQLGDSSKTKLPNGKHTSSPKDKAITDDIAISSDSASTKPLNDPRLDKSPIHLSAQAKNDTIPVDNLDLIKKETSVKLPIINKINQNEQQVNILTTVQVDEITSTNPSFLEESFPEPPAISAINLDEQLLSDLNEDTSTLDELLLTEESSVELPEKNAIDEQFSAFITQADENTEITNPESQSDEAGKNSAQVLYNKTILPTEIDKKVSNPNQIPTKFSSNGESNVTTDIDFYLVLAFLFLVILTALLIYRWFICKNNVISLTNIPLPWLPKQYKLLQRTRCLNKVLVKNHVPEKYLNDAIAFVQKMTPVIQAETLAKRLKDIRLKQIKPNLFSVYLHDNFPLNLPSFLLFFPTPNASISTILEYLKQHTTGQKVVIITLSNRQQQALRPYAENHSNLWVVPNYSELTSWLLLPNPVPIFTQILAEQLKLTQISPYQTRGGVNNNTIFFGRSHILDCILQHELTNYIIVGGRQIGKSSLLKYIHRHYQSHPQVKCYYLSLHSDNLQGQLAVALGLPSKINLDTILAKMVEIASKQQQLFLLDEADLFILAERKNGYPLLKRLHNISNQKRCHFILAGFWDLYQAFRLDKSPLQDFAKLVKITELEAEACRDLAVKPMQTMNLHYARKELINKLMIKTGQRANLIAMICNEMLQNMSNQKRVLDDKDIELAFNSDTVSEILTEWQIKGKLVDEPASHLDRIIIYATIKQGKFNFDELQDKLNKLKCVYTDSQIQQSLERLVFNFVLKQTQPDYYAYCVPLFQDKLLEDDVNELLRWEL